MKTKFLATLLSLLVVSVLTGCSASGHKVVTPANGALPVSYVALLPVAVPEGMRSERVERTRDLVSTELKNKGVLVVDDRVVNDVCSVPACPEWPRLFERYKVDAVADLKLDSVSTGDFVVGRYSSISGTIEFRDRSGATMLKNEQTTRQAGGLILNTGAVVQAFRTLSDSFQDNVFEPLAVRFSRDLLGDVQFAGNGAGGDSSSKLNIGTLSVRNVSATRKKICVDASPNNLLTISSKNLVSDLQEITPGNYCAVYPARSIQSESYQAQLRTPSGISVNKQFSLPLEVGKM